MNFKRSKFSSFMDIVLPITAIIILSILMYRIYIEVGHMRMDYIDDFSSVIHISLTSAVSEEDLINKSEMMVQYLNSIENKAVFIYDKTLISLFAKGSFQFDLSDGSELHELILTNDRGYLTQIIDGVEQDVRFEWIYVPSMEKTYLLLYSISKRLMDFTFTYTFTYIAILCILIYAVKVNLVDRMVYATILQKSQKQLIDDFESRKFN